jgi:serine/threonine protein kinase
MTSFRTLHRGSITVCIKISYMFMAYSRGYPLLDLDLAVHSVPVVHGDLTTVRRNISEHFFGVSTLSLQKNVLLNDEKRAVLTDFGLSSMLADQGHSYLQRSRAQPGAIRYCAPELLNPSLSIKPHTRSDVYSFGCVAFRVGFHCFA